jgi:hypothetical protein
MVLLQDFLSILILRYGTVIQLLGSGSDLALKFADPSGFGSTTLIVYINTSVFKYFLIKLYLITVLISYRDLCPCYEKFFSSFF